MKSFWLHVRRDAPRFTGVARTHALRHLAGPLVLAPMVLAPTVLAPMVLVASAAVAEPGKRPEPLRPNASLDLAALTTLISERTPDVAAATLDVELAETNVARAKLWENPSVDVLWGTIPVGKPNLPEPQARDPLTYIPNYGVGVSMPMTFWRASLRGEQAQAELAGARAMLQGKTRERALRLARAIGDVAIRQLRVDSTHGLVDLSQRAWKVSEERYAQQFATALDVDRLRIEAERNEQQWRGAQADLTRALAACGDAAARPCEPFASVDEAHRFIEAWTDAAVNRARTIEARPDLVSLGEQSRAATLEGKVARSQAIPDVTLRLSYLHDQFTLSGNQGNSLNVGVGVTVPLFDHGQAAARAADAKETRLHEVHEKAVSVAHAQLPGILSTLEQERNRRQHLVAELLPRARAVVADLEHAAAGRLVTLLEVIQARRTLFELAVDETDSLGAAMDAAVDLELLAPSNPAPAAAPRTPSPSGDSSTKANIR